MVEPSGALEGGARGAAWQRRWGHLRARRIAILVALPLGLLVGVLSGGWPGWLIAVGMPAVALIRLHAFRCPECRGRFTGTAIAPMPSACRTCGLAAFDDPETNVASAATGATRRSMPPSIRLVEHHGDGVSYAAVSSVAAGRLHAYEAVPRRVE